MIAARKPRAACSTSRAPVSARTTAIRVAPASRTARTFAAEMPPIAKNGTVACAAA